MSFSEMTDKLGHLQSNTANSLLFLRNNWLDDHGRTLETTLFSYLEHFCLELKQLSSQMQEEHEKNMTAVETVAADISRISTSCFEISGQLESLEIEQKGCAMAVRTSAEHIKKYAEKNDELLKLLNEATEDQKI